MAVKRCTHLGVKPAWNGRLFSGQWTAAFHCCVFPSPGEYLWSPVWAPEGVVTSPRSPGRVARASSCHVSCAWCW